MRTEPTFSVVKVGLFKWDKLRCDFLLCGGCEGVDVLQIFEVMKSHNNITNYYILFHIFKVEIFPRSNICESKLRVKVR